MDEMVKIPVETYYMSASKDSLAHFTLAADYTVSAWHSPAPATYLSYYQKVGTPWGWTGRLKLSSQQLKEALSSSQNHIFLLKYRETFAGFAEYIIKGQEAELLYFGLSPDFIGKKLGLPFLSHSLNRILDMGVEHIWLHTCEYDHPSALSTYQKAGFSTYDTKTEMEYYPSRMVKHKHP